jgi:Rrf2 family protein
MSRKCDYALRALIRMAANPTAGYHSIADLAAAEDIPLRYLEQIFLALKNAGILSAKSGPKGGYRLQRDPSDITLIDVVRLIDGPVAPARCVSRTAYEKCPRESVCALRPVISDVRDAIAAVLESITLESVCKRPSVKAALKMSPKPGRSKH